MPRGKSRKRSTSDSNNSNKMWNSKKKRSSTKDSGSGNTYPGIHEASAEKLFVELADPEDPEIINMEGIFALGEKLDMDATEDIRILVLLWKMNVGHEKPSQISKHEWMQGCAGLSVDTWAKFKALVPSLDTGFLETTEFKDFYKFCFTFSRQGTHKSLEKDLVLALLGLVLGGGGDGGKDKKKKDTTPPRVPKDRLDSFTKFLEGNASYTHMNLDQWTSFLDFCLEVPDLSAYDESTSAWPVIIDEYVEYMEEQQQQQGTKK